MGLILWLGEGSAARAHPAKVSPVHFPSTMARAMAVPDGFVLQARVHAVGTQDYVCRDNKDAPSWTFDGPEAELRDDSGRVVGKHGAGPSWEWHDGSAVAGQVRVIVDAPFASAVPWLLIESTQHHGAGFLATVGFVQRVDTEGGLMPTSGCDASHRGARAQVPYHAIYTFWRPRLPGQPN